MPWESMTIEEFAASLGANITEIREKQRLIGLVIKIRKAKKMSQTALAKKLGVTQARVAQIESRIGTAKVSFDVIFNILTTLGYDYRVITKKAA